jgi:hypothetical protein
MVVTDMGHINDTGATDEHVSELYYGERIVSFRALMKRYTTVMRTALLSTTTNVILGAAWNLFRYPVYDGWYSGDPTLSTNATGVKNLFNYLRFGFMGMRGSYRYRIRNYVSNIDTTCSYAVSTLYPEQSFTGYGAELQELNTSILNADSLSGFHARIEGTAVHHLESNGGLEIEIPYYESVLFDFAFADDPIDDRGEYYGNVMNSVYCNTAYRTTSYNTSVLFAEGATGEDFTFLRFQGAAPYQPF